MKNKFNLIGMLILVVALCFAVSCGEGGGGGAGEEGNCEHSFSTIPATCTADSVPGTCTKENCDEPDPAAVVSKLGHDHVSSLICKRTECDHQYALGDTGPAGGIIFHIVPGGFDVLGYSGGTGATAHLNFSAYTAYYLEVAPANEPSTAQWGAYGTLISGVTTFTSTGAAEASIIGNGRKDTYTIATHLNNNTSETNRAAQLCANKSLNSFNDWFLPSSGELNQLYINRVAVNEAGGSLGTSWFWSSSQLSSLTAWVQDFASGDRGIYYKNNPFIVRAVRAF